MESIYLKHYLHFNISAQTYILVSAESSADLTHNNTLGFYRQTSSTCNTFPVWKRAESCHVSYIFRRSGGKWGISETPCNSASGLRFRSTSQDSLSPFGLEWEYEKNGSWLVEKKLQVLRRKTKKRGAYFQNC